MRLSLVPAYSPCTAPNRTHGPPLASASCNPPVADVEPGDGGHAPTRWAARPTSWASSAMRWSSETPGLPEDSDVAITSSMSDVRCRPAGASCGSANAAGPADYTGEVRATVGLRMTDRWNAVAPGGGRMRAPARASRWPGASRARRPPSTGTGSTLHAQHDGQRDRARAGAGHASGRSGRWTRSGSTTAGRTATPTPPPATRCSRCRASSFHRAGRDRPLKSGPCRAC